MDTKERPLGQRILYGAGTLLLLASGAFTGSALAHQREQKIMDGVSPKEIKLASINPSPELMQDLQAPSQQKKEVINVQMSEEWMRYPYIVNFFLDVARSLIRSRQDVTSEKLLQRATERLRAFLPDLPDIQEENNNPKILESAQEFLHQRAEIQSQILNFSPLATEPQKLSKEYVPPFDAKEWENAPFVRAKLIEILLTTNGVFGPTIAYLPDQDQNKFRCKALNDLNDIIHKEFSTNLTIKPCGNNPEFVKLIDSFFEAASRTNEEIAHELDKGKGGSLKRNFPHRRAHGGNSAPVAEAVVVGKSASCP